MRLGIEAGLAGRQAAVAQAAESDNEIHSGGGCQQRQSAGSSATKQNLRPFGRVKVVERSRARLTRSCCLNLWGFWLALAAATMERAESIIRRCFPRKAAEARPLSARAIHIHITVET